MYTSKLVFGGKVEHLDSSESMDTLIDDLVSFGWEADPDELVRSMVSIESDEDGVVATATWHSVPCREWPDLVILRAGTSVTRHRRVETETSYTHQLVA